jgi:hypothetical protein
LFRLTLFLSLLVSFFFPLNYPLSKDQFVILFDQTMLGKHIHTHTHTSSLFLSVSLYLSLFLSLCLSISLSLCFRLSVYLYDSVSLSLSFFLRPSVFCFLFVWSPIFHVTVLLFSFLFPSPFYRFSCFDLYLKIYSVFWVRGLHTKTDLVFM